MRKSFYNGLIESTEIVAGINYAVAPTKMHVETTGYTSSHIDTMLPIQSLPGKQFAFFISNTRKNIMMVYGLEYLSQRLSINNDIESVSNQVFTSIHLCYVFKQRFELYGGLTFSLFPAKLIWKYPTGMRERGQQKEIMYLKFGLKFRPTYRLRIGVEYYGNSESPFYYISSTNRSVFDYSLDSSARCRLSMMQINLSYLIKFKRGERINQGVFLYKRL